MKLGEFDIKLSHITDVGYTCYVTDISTQTGIVRTLSTLMAKKGEKTSHRCSIQGLNTLL